MIPFYSFSESILAKKLSLWPTLKPGPGTSHNDEDSTEIDQKKDSLGHEESSPDYVDEYLLRSWEEGDSQLSEPELEQKRLEAAQYKIEGNALYTDGKIREACGKLLSIFNFSCVLSINKRDVNVLWAVLRLCDPDLTHKIYLFCLLAKLRE